MTERREYSEGEDYDPKVHRDRRQTERRHESLSNGMSPLAKWGIGIVATIVGATILGTAQVALNMWKTDDLRDQQIRVLREDLIAADAQFERKIQLLADRMTDQAAAFTNQTAKLGEVMGQRVKNAEERIQRVEARVTRENSEIRNVQRQLMMKTYGTKPEK